ncbi:MAG: hypothetical protein ACK5M7_12975 [Draconibacterium sp.]
MITIQKIGKLLLMFLVVAGMTSCNDDDDVPFSITGDVVTFKQMINDSVSYAPAYYAYGNYKMTSAKVTLPSGDSITLTDNEYGQSTYYQYPDSTDFSTEIPEEGTYTFTVVNEGITHSATDELEVKNLEIPTITEVTAAAGTANGTLTVNWESDTNTDNYVVWLKNDSGEVIFATKSLPNTSTTYIISASTGFTKQFESGKSYTVEVHALLYEDSALDYLYNVEMIAIGSEDIVWE